mmetsp:Transcript_129479/g.415021  ORF Transcript_129479/g.415021 Transcript_129479/m.415021 type:complete len:293 (+) Transcript_129479:68-946(+)
MALPPLLEVLRLDPEGDPAAGDDRERQDHEDDQEEVAVEPVVRHGEGACAPLAAEGQLTGLPQRVEELERLRAVGGVDGQDAAAHLERLVVRAADADTPQFPLAHHIRHCMLSIVLVILMVLGLERGRLRELDPCTAGGVHERRTQYRHSLDAAVLARERLDEGSLTTEVPSTVDNGRLDLGQQHPPTQLWDMNEPIILHVVSPNAPGHSNKSIGGAGGAVVEVETCIDACASAAEAVAVRILSAFDDLGSEVLGALRLVLQVAAAGFQHREDRAPLVAPKPGGLLQPRVPG